MVLKSSIDCKVRPLTNPSLDKASLVGAARVYVSRDSLLSLTGTLNNGKLCSLEKLPLDPQGEDEHEPIVRQASLWILPEKSLSPNVVMMTRAFQDATGFRMGDQVRLSVMADVPVADEIVVQEHVAEGEKPEPIPEMLHPLTWEGPISFSCDRVELIFPGMVFLNITQNKFSRSWKVVSVNSQRDNIARFKLATTAVRILSPEEAAAETAPASTGPLVIGEVPGLTAQVERLNEFLAYFGSQWCVREETLSCGIVIHGSRGTGKTFILNRIAETNWGRVHRIDPTDKLTAIRETFNTARAQQPSIVLLEDLAAIIPKDRTNRDAVIRAIADELDALAKEARKNKVLPCVVVVATCEDYLNDVPIQLQNLDRFHENIPLPLPRIEERRQILQYLDPPLRPEERNKCLDIMAQKTHAFNGRDLEILVRAAKKFPRRRLKAANIAIEQAGEQFITKDDLEQALRVTRPTAMHDINLKPPTIHWQDVGGQEKLKKVLSGMIRNAKSSNSLTRFILPTPPKGLLLYGPPGCSKTLSAQAMATESGFNFFAVKGAELLNMYVGESERAIRTLFERARAASPSIIFFDEIDSISGQRTGSGAATRSTGAVNMLTTLLTEMDGFETLAGVLILAATNRPESIDPALLRPGRFDHVVYVGPPNLEARAAVFNVHLRGLWLAADVDIGQLAELTEGFSGAEIKAICTEAGLAVLDRVTDESWSEGVQPEGAKSEGAESEGAEPKAPRPEITMQDLKVAIEITPKGITRQMVEGYEKWSKQSRRT